MFDKSLVLDAMRFELLGTQRGGSAVYRGDGAYLRVGVKGVIQPDLALHRAMERAQYPVAPIISEGELGEKYYFIEKSLGPCSFRAIFQEECKKNSGVSDESFHVFIKVLKKLFSAQIKASAKEWDSDEFAEGIRLPALCAELPDHAKTIRTRFEAAIARLRKLPGTLTHGDCNPANVYEDGIIDLEDSFKGPLGYDIISALVTIEWSPDTRDYEFFARYRFTEEQQNTYVRAFAALATKAHCPDLAGNVEDLAFCRAIWLCSGMGAWPRIQQWRFEKFVKEYLS